MSEFGRPSGVLTDHFDCRSRQTAWGPASAANSGSLDGPSAHRVHVKSRSDAAPPWPNGGSSGGCRWVAGLLVTAPADRSMEGALGSQPRGVGAPREDGSSAPPERRASARSDGGVTESASGTFFRLGCCRTSTPRVMRHAHQRGSPLAGRSSVAAASVCDAHSQRSLGPDVLATACRRRRRVLRFQRV